MHGGCAAFLIDAYVSLSCLAFRLGWLACSRKNEIVILLFFGCRCTTLVFLAASRSPGVSASMDVVYHAPAAP
jgi:hypothetical protein